MGEDLQSRARILGVGGDPWASAWLGPVPTNLGPRVDAIVELDDPVSLTDEHTLAAWYQGGAVMVSGPHIVLEGRTDVIKGIPVDPNALLQIVIHGPWWTRSAVNVATGEPGTAQDVYVKVRFVPAGQGDAVADQQEREKRKEKLGFVERLFDAISNASTATIVVGVVALFVLSGADEVSRAGAHTASNKLKGD